MRGRGHGGGGRASETRMRREGGRAGELFMRPIQRRRGRGGVAGRTGEARPGRARVVVAAAQGRLARVVVASLKDTLVLRKEKLALLC